MTAAEFKSLFLPCHLKLYRMAYLLTSNKQQAEDLVQETYLKLWIKRKEINATEGYESYAIITLRNIFKDQYRRKRILFSEKDVSESTIGESVPNAQIDDEIDKYELVLTCIEQLKEPDRSIMKMKDIECMNYNKIAEKTGMTETNLRSILCRARKKIRAILKEKQSI